MVSNQPCRAALQCTALAMIVFLAGLFGTGCGKNEIDRALDSDANGYLCRICKARFYTSREVFANVCPACKTTQIIQVVGFVCPDDHYVSIGPRGTGTIVCEKCNKPTSGLSIPREAELKQWGAAKKSRAEVGS
jgi:DNA-directed RNA polymerase subunit RPC12/RpoP